MVTTNCQELAGVDCQVPISGNSVEELKKNVFAHGQTEHQDILKKMTPADQANLIQSIERIFNKKSQAAATSRS